MGDNQEENLSKKKDPGWKYCFLADKNNSNKVTCKFCGKITTGGISRGKQHLIGNHRNSTKCPKCPPEVKKELLEYNTAKARIKKDYI